MRWFILSALLGILGMSASPVQAGLLPLNVTVTKVGDDYRYTYPVVLNSSSKLVRGDFFTIYDFNGFIEGSNTQPAGFELTTVMSGGTPGRTIPSDDPNVPNLIWTWMGDSTLVGPLELGNFTALSKNNVSGTDSAFTGRTHIEDPQGRPRIDDNITDTSVPGTSTDGPVSPPQVPEPSTLILLAAGLPLMLGARFARTRKMA